jgi:hypothetical protein
VASFGFVAHETLELALGDDPDTSLSLTDLLAAEAALPQPDPDELRIPAQSLGYLRNGEPFHVLGVYK